MISIIVPNYNHRIFLPKRLETIFYQTFQDFEVILLDDCSTDESWEYLKTFENHPKVSHCIRNEVNSGSPFRQWKRGLELAKYEWIWIAESDDFSSINFLETLFLRKEPETTLIFSNSNLINENNDLISNSKIWAEMDDFQISNDLILVDGRDFVIDYLSKRNFIFNASSVLFKRPDGFPVCIESMKYTGDWYFWIWLASNGKVSYVKQKLNYFRFHQGTTRNFKGNESELAYNQEIMNCFSYCFSFLSFSNWIKTDLFYYDQFIGKYFKYLYRTGRSRFRAVFPKLPFVFLPFYYRYYIKSFF